LKSSLTLLESAYSQAASQYNALQVGWNSRSYDFHFEKWVKNDYINENLEFKGMLL
jgi:hypothetical protein